MTGLLHPAGIGVADMPPGLFAYPTPDWARTVRLIEPWIAAGYSDAEAWSALFVDDDGLERNASPSGVILPQNIITAQAVYGNRPSKRERSTPRLPAKPRYQPAAMPAPARQQQLAFGP